MPSMTLRLKACRKHEVAVAILQSLVKILAIFKKMHLLYQIIYVESKNMSETGDRISMINCMQRDTYKTKFLTKSEPI